MHQNICLGNIKVVKPLRPIGLDLDRTICCYKKKNNQLLQESKGSNISLLMLD